jgi:hypothetical protein
VKLRFRLVLFSVSTQLYVSIEICCFYPSENLCVGTYVKHMH